VQFDFAQCERWVGAECEGWEALFPSTLTTPAEAGA